MENTILQDLLDDVAELEADYMLKSDYDIDDNKIVDEAESIDGGSF